MKQKFEYFKGTSISNSKDMKLIIEKLPNNIYFVGHRLEDDVCIDSILSDSEFILSEQFNDCYIGKASRNQFISMVSFLKENFISGYILWFKEAINCSVLDFGEMFIGSKKEGLLTSIYKARHSSLLNYDFYVPIELKCKIGGMVFTDSGESSILLLENEYKV